MMRAGVVFVLIGLLGLLPARAAEVYFRLIDAKRNLPLEFWQKDEPLVDGVLYHRMPTAVFIDNLAQNYASYGGEQGPQEAGADNLNLESEAAPDPKVESDRKSDVIGGIGVKALVKVELPEGAHVFQPGGLRFTVADKTGIAATDPALERITRVCFYVRCYPVDINLLRAAGGPGKVDITVTSGAQTVYEESLDAGRPAVLRLYLPPGAAYEVKLGDFGNFTMTVTPEGAKVLHASEGLTAFAQHFTVALRRGDPPVAPRPAAEAGASELYLFTDRNREVFAEGERVPLSVRAWGAAARAGTATLSLPGLPPAPVALHPAGDGAAAEVELDTAPLRPGRYTLTLTAGDTTSNALPLTIAPLLGPTNMKIFSHLKWGESTMAPERLSQLADLGFSWLSNTEGTNGNDMQQCVFDSWDGVPADPARVQALPAGAHLPPELTEARTPVSVGMETLLAHGVQYLSTHIGLILYFNVGDSWRDQADDRYQTTRHAGMLLRRYPNFAGMTYCTGDGPTPATMGWVFGSAGVASFDVIHEERMKKLHDLFEQQYGKLGVDLSTTGKAAPLTDKEIAEREKHGLAWGFHLGEDVRLPVTGDDEKAIVWNQWVNDLYPDSFRAVKAGLQQMVRNPLLTSGASWGGGAGGGMYAGAFYRALDFPLNDLHGDYGNCNFNEISMTDILDMGMEDAPARPWVALDLVKNRSKEVGFKHLLQALSRTPSGVGVLDTSQGDWVCGWANDKQRSEDLLQLTDLAARFGDVFSTINRVDDIAIVSSFRQETLGGQSCGALYAAHFLTQKAGYQANVITDAYVAKHADELAQRFRALFFFQMTKPLSPGMKAALEIYRKAGGHIIVDAGTTVEIPEAIKLPFAVPANHGPSNFNDHLECEEFFLPLCTQFRAAVAPVLPPLFTFTSRRNTLHSAINWNAFRARSGDVEYWIVVNDGKPKMDNGVEAQFRYEADAAEVHSTLSGVLYDALRRAPVATTPASQGVSFTCDGMHYPGTIYLVTPRPVASLSVSVSPSVAQGQAVVLRAAALDGAGTAFTGVLPVEFTVLDPDGVTRYHLFRTTNRDLTLKIAVNDPAGAWTWRAVEQATGLTAHGTVTVTTAAAKPQVTALGTVVCDAAAVYAFLKRPVTIALNHSETALLPQAQALADGLKARGVKAEVRILWPSEQRDYPMQWFYRTAEDLELNDNLLAGEIVGQRVVGKNQFGNHKNDNFGNFAYYKHYTGSAPYLYYRDVILLGREDVAPGPLLSTILRGRMLLRNPSASFPARDAGMLGYAWGPFEARYDAVVCYGTGPAGLEQATASLLALAERKEAPARAFVPALPRTAPENGEAYREMAVAPAPGALVATAGNTREAVSLLPPVYGSVIAEARGDGERLLLLRHDLPDPEHPAATRCVLANTGDWSAAASTVPDGLASVDTGTLAWSLAQDGKRWPAPNGYPLGNDYLAAAAFGVGRYHLDGTPVWFYDPYPVFNSYDEAKYPRRVRQLGLSPDGSLALAAFYSKTPDQEFVPWRHNRCDVALLDATSGKALATLERYHGNDLRIAADNSTLTVLDIFHDNPDEHIHRAIENPHNGPGLAVFSRDGAEQHFFPLAREVESLTTDPNLTLAVLRFTDARRRVTVCDLRAGTQADFHYPRIDLGASASADGAFSVVTFTDGAVVRLDRAGALVWKTMLPCAGQPAVLADHRIAVATSDGSVTLLDVEGKVLGTHALAGAKETPWHAVVDPLPATLEAPAPTPWWDAPPPNIPVVALKTPAFTLPAAGKQLTATLTLPALGATKIVLVAFTYALADPHDTLTVHLEGAGISASYPLPAHLTPWPAAIPLRVPDGGEVTLTLSCAHSVALQNARLLLVDTSAWHNAAATSEDQPSKSAPLPRLMVPNVFGLTGDPRVEQMSFGVKGANVYRLFDGDVYSGMDLYDVRYPQNAAWDGGAEPDLRSARIVMEFHDKHTMLGLGLWNAPGDLPVEGWALECCDSYTKDEQMTKELIAKWKCVASGHGNTAIYSLQGFPPTKARVWRLTLTRTLANMQRLAEVELFEDNRDTVGQDDNQDTDNPELK